jgi:hypothetical protein
MLLRESPLTYPDVSIPHVQIAHYLVQSKDLNAIGGEKIPDRGENQADE